jgi:hypothetical protein
MDRRQFLAAASSLAVPGALSGAEETRVAPPAEILLFRHGEKTGDPTDLHLNPRGRLRAAALPRLFPQRFDTPDFLFASKVSERSNRAVETITPLAQVLHLPIDHRFLNEDYAALVTEVFTHSQYSGKVVLICWHHGNLAPLAAALGVNERLAPWPDNQFDRVWRLRYSGGVAFADLPQHLLEGDS